MVISTDMNKWGVSATREERMMIEWVNININEFALTLVYMNPIASKYTTIHIISDKTGNLFQKRWFVGCCVDM